MDKRLGKSSQIAIAFIPIEVLHLTSNGIVSKYNVADFTYPWLSILA